MEIVWHGYKCFQIKTKAGSVMVDPYKAEVGLKIGNVKSNAIVFTDENDKENNLEMASAETKVFSWPGEYEIAGIALTIQKLVPPDGKKTTESMLVSFDIDNVKVCYLTDLTITLTDEMTERFGNVDVLVVPVDQKKGGYSKVHQLIEELEPRIVIPIYYATTGIKAPLDSIDQFLKKTGLNNVTEKEKFAVNSKSDLPQEKTEFVVLKAQTA